MRQRPLAGVPEIRALLIRAGNQGKQVCTGTGERHRRDGGLRAMAARPRGQVVERYGKSGRTYAIRFHAYGRRRYLTLGRGSEGWTRRRAEDELSNVLADVRRDLWVGRSRAHGDITDRRSERSSLRSFQTICWPNAALR